MDFSKKPNKIREIVRLQQILKKWRNKANSSPSPSSSTSCNKRTKQLILRRASPATPVPKGYLAVSVGDEQKRFVIPTEYLGRRAFQGFLREAEEEFGFEQAGVLRIPCEVSVFEKVLNGMQGQNDRSSSSLSFLLSGNERYRCCSSSERKLGSSSQYSDHSPLCR